MSGDFTPEQTRYLEGVMRRHEIETLKAMMAPEAVA